MRWWDETARVTHTGHLAGAGMQGAGILGRESISSEKTKLKCPDLACVDNRAASSDTFFCQAQGPGQFYSLYSSHMCVVLASIYYLCQVQEEPNITSRYAVSAAWLRNWLSYFLFFFRFCTLNSSLYLAYCGFVSVLNCCYQSIVTLPKRIREALKRTYFKPLTSCYF